ncbi:sensor histidine kinase [Oceanibacterium hippocampi]|uniref:histidine kinase n=1 Tax=Oceanibacterium hippocampi TaxID=745714 RepID=A0A1Y5RNW6_9PROT|nr:stimulus-sensing domain-containing protein [Oceanibacterium hippocampi]SLN22074.1 Signal transduction histidine-protein kinase/phosphatase MprB [Oceanibacterium hippocampi]
MTASPPLRADGPGTGSASAVRRRWPFSSLTGRILAINVVALVLMVGGIFYLDQFRSGLIEARIHSLRTEATLIAGALGEAALRHTSESSASTELTLRNEATPGILRRMMVPLRSTAFLFDEDGVLVADSRRLIAAGREVLIEPLPPPEESSWPTEVAEEAYDAIAEVLGSDDDLTPYIDRLTPRFEDFEEAVLALSGESAERLRRHISGRTMISAAIPVQGLKQVLGVLVIVTDSRQIDETVRSEQLTTLMVLAGTLGVTALLSLFFASTIARPIRRLALAAERVRKGIGRRADIPDFRRRGDEIGDLSGALREMTRALYRRIDATESFAADVAHELKNPLTSLSSAVETLQRDVDPDKRALLQKIIRDDVGRLDRLISDISNASRLDAELSRSETEDVDMGELLDRVVEVYRATQPASLPPITVDVGNGDPLIVAGLEIRLGQVIRNLIDNARTFTPEGGSIRLRGYRDDDDVIIEVEDDGPGIPEAKRQAIFDRFYSERPRGEAFGTHSGLGLSISKQIIEAHGGAISAENRRRPGGGVIGARFRIVLPARS